MTASNVPSPNSSSRALATRASGTDAALQRLGEIDGTFLGLPRQPGAEQHAGTGADVEQPGPPTYTRGVKCRVRRATGQVFELRRVAGRERFVNSLSP